jgi:DNA repair exonuclease SbcCD ATPase subunit
VSTKPGQVQISDEHQASYDEEVRSWVERTYSLINDAFGKAQAQRFISNEGLTDEELFGRELPPSVHLSSTRRKYLLPARLKRLHAVIDSVNSLEVNSDFDPQNVAQEYGESAAAQLRLMTALEQATVDIEKLKAASERLTAERDEAKLESRTFKSERDGQVRGRCLELSRELSDFLEEARGQDPKETMHQYNQRFRDRVDRLRSDVMRLGWWKPKESAREKLEYPTHPDDLLGLADYLNASCGHGFW